MKINEKRLYIAVALGLGLSLLPELLSHIVTSEAKYVDSLFQWMGIILLPGLLVSVGFSGNVHDYNLFIAIAVSVLFYSVLFYLLLTILARFRRKASRPGTSVG